MKSLLKKREHAHDALERLRASSGRQLGLLARSAAEAASKSGADRNRFAAANREADEARADAAALRASLAKRLGKALRASSTEADRAAGLAARLGQAEKVLQRCQAELAKVRKAPRGAADPASRDADSAADRATIRELRAKICCNVCLDREKTTVLTSPPALQPWKFGDTHPPSPPALGDASTPFAGPAWTRCCTTARASAPPATRPLEPPTSRTCSSSEQSS